jgi:hypothetical protein
MLSDCLKVFPTSPGQCTALKMISGHIETSE